MMKYLILFSYILLTYNFYSQTERFNIIEQAINLPDFVTLVNQQTIFNTEKELTIYIDSSLIETKKYQFNNTKIEYYDISVPLNRMSVTYNFVFTKLDFTPKEVQIDFTFYPNWIIETNGRKFPTYNNGNYIKVESTFYKEGNKWILKNHTIHDIEFQDWMYEKGSGFDYITKNYIPLK